MSLAQEDIQYIKEQMPRWLAAQSFVSSTEAYEVDLRERTIRVEEELKHQRGLMLQGFENTKQGFAQMDKRFEAMQKQMDKRFEQVNKRFEQVDKRFESMQQHMDKRFESMQQQMDKRFEQVDKRFESMQQHMDKRFEAMQENTNKIATRHDRMQWMIVLMIATYFFKDKLVPLLGG